MSQITTDRPHPRPHSQLVQPTTPAKPCNNKPKAKRCQLHPMAKLTAEERGLLQRGLEWVGFKRRKRKTTALVRRFKSMFGEGLVAINKLFKDCQQKQRKFKEKYALMTLQWLKTYATEVDLAGRYDCCERTAEKKTKEYVRLFQSFKKSKVRFSGFDERVYQFSVDGQNYKQTSSGCLLQANGTTTNVTRQE